MFVSATAAKSKASCGWTPLHLATNFGHKDVVEELLKVRRWDLVCVCVCACAIYAGSKVTFRDPLAGRR